MRTVGVICEYNPLHNGHLRQLSLIRQAAPKAGIVCLMSGNFVQRGEPAQFHKSLRAKAAILSGADLVLELPVQYVLSSAEGFAAGGVRILGAFCDALSFGCESGEPVPLMETAKLLLDGRMDELIRQELALGVSYPTAREKALARLGGQSDLLRRPNDILAVEYCKAILRQNLPMDIFPIVRNGDYHASVPDTDAPSASSLRAMVNSGSDIRPYVPSEAFALFQGASVHTLAQGEKAILARLRTMQDAEFEALPFGAEGLWRKLMHECRTQPDLASILAAVKSKRYTHSRLCRMVMCAFLGIDQNTLSSQPGYVRALALNDRGREILRSARESIPIYNTGEATDSSQWTLEQRCEDLYSLFSSLPEPPGGAKQNRIQYVPINTA